jgi:hypothetical protein
VCKTYKVTFFGVAKSNKLSVYKTRVTCICFIAKNHFAENSVCESNCYGVKCTNLTRHSILILERRLECIGYYS